jgi:Flp pilus assembly protein TadB
MRKRGREGWAAIQKERRENPAAYRNLLAFITPLGLCLLFLLYILTQSPIVGVPLVLLGGWSLYALIRAFLRAQSRRGR